MPIKSPATASDLARVREDQKAEIVGGELVLMSPSGGKPGRAASRIWRSLDDYERGRGGGYAFGDNVGFLVDLPHRKSFSPDAGFFRGPVSMGFQQGAPVFAAEVRSEHDYGGAAEGEMARKRADYFAAGTLVVWDVDLVGEDTVRVHRRDDAGNPTIYRRGQIAEAEPAVPGWTMPVDDLFAW